MMIGVPSASSAPLQDTENFRVHAVAQATESNLAVANETVIGSRSSTRSLGRAPSASEDAGRFPARSEIGIADVRGDQLFERAASCSAALGTMSTSFLSATMNERLAVKYGRSSPSLLSTLTTTV